MDGFKKILKLFAEDKQLTKEILQTLQHFLDAAQNPAVQSKLEDTNGNVTAAIKKEFFTGRVGNIISDFTKIVSAELQKLFSSCKSQYCEIIFS